MDEHDTIREILRQFKWQEAKAALQSILMTYTKTDRDVSYKSAKKSIDEFISSMEDVVDY